MFVKLQFLQENLYKVANSTGNIISLLGYNKIFANFFDKKFGSNAFLIARWFKEYYNETIPDPLGNKNFQITIDVIKASMISHEHVLDTLKYYNIYDGENIDEYISSFINDFNSNFINNYSFFHTTLISAIMKDGIDVERYKKLSFEDALKLFNKRNIGDDANTLIKYKNGYRWVNVGRRNESVGEDLSNCGSAGFSSDPDAKLLVLFNKQLTAKLIATYKPGSNSIDNLEMKGGKKEIDEKYYPYVLDLKNNFNYNYNDYEDNMKLWMLYNFEIKMTDFYISASGFFKTYIFEIDGEKWYNNGYLFIKESELFKFITNEFNTQDIDKSLITKAIIELKSNYNLYDNTYDILNLVKFEQYIGSLKR